MVEFVLFCLPTVVYLIMRSRGPERSLPTAMQRAGISWGTPSAYGWALVLLLPLLATGWLAIRVVPQEVLAQPGVSIAQFASAGAVAGAALRAVGEEVFFRGLLGGALVRRLGFAWGNLIQAALFLIPHLPLLLVDIRLWTILPVQFATGWLLGWLRHKTGSFVPGAVIHVAANLASGLLAA